MLRLQNMPFHTHEPVTSDAAPIRESRFKVAAVDLFARAIGIMVKIDGIPYGRNSKRQDASKVLPSSATNLPHFL